MTRDTNIPIPAAIFWAYAGAALEVLMLIDEWLINDPSRAGEDFFKSRAPSPLLPDYVAFVLASEHILANPSIDTSIFLAGHSEWDWEDDEIREILRLIRSASWSERPPPLSMVQRVVLTDETLWAWRERLKATNGEPGLPTW